MREREPVAGMIVFGALGAVLCGLALWLEWSPVVWWIGAAIVLLALVVIAWRRGIKRRPLWVAGAAVVGLAVAAVPVLEPVLRPSAEVAWSVEGTEEPIAQASLPADDGASIILTSDADHMVRARAAEDGTVLWQHRGTVQPHFLSPRVDVAGDLVLIGADDLAEPGEEMVALEVSTGEERWSGPAHVAPLVRNDSVLVVYASDQDRGDVHRGLDMDTGETLWTAAGSRGAWNSVPMGTPGAVVPFSEWLQAESSSATGDSGTGIRHTITEVDTGERHTVSGTTGLWSAGVVGDQFVVQEMLVDPAEVDSGDTVTTKVTAYHLPDGGVDWEAEIDLSYHDWIDFSYRRPQLITFDSTRLQASTVEHTVEVLDLRDGRLNQFHLPTDGPYGSSGNISWSHDDVALGSTSGRWSVIDLDTEEVTALADDDAPYERPRATAWLNGTASPAWQEDGEGLFGREYQQLTALDLTDRTAPELVELGDLPEGAVEGTYAGRVVLVDSEEIPDAADDEPQERTTALHVLAPFD